MKKNNPQKYLFANWKMYLDLAQSVKFANELKKEVAKLPDNIKLAVFPSNLAFSSVAEVFAGSGSAVGAQNVYWVSEGGYTGEVSAQMFASAGAQFALVGHSERRHQFHETNHEVRLKMEAILDAGLTPVLCVGETAKEHKAGEAHEAVEAQVRAAYAGLKWPAKCPIMVAYEPVWAVGTGVMCSPVDAEKMSADIIALVKGLTGTEPTVLYGGSVRSKSVATILAEPHISGILVGGASAKKESWMEIIHEAVAAQ